MMKTACPRAVRVPHATLLPGATAAVAPSFAVTCFALTVLTQTKRSSAVQESSHVLVPPASSKRHAMPFHLFYQEQKLDVDLFMTVLRLKELMKHFASITAMRLSKRSILSSRSWRSLNLDMFDSLGAALPDPTGAARAAHGDNVPWDRSEHPDMGKEHMLTACLHT